MFFAANKMSRIGSIKYQDFDDCIAITIEMNVQKSYGFTCTITYTEDMFNCLQSWIKVIIYELIDNVCKSNFEKHYKKIPQKFWRKSTKVKSDDFRIPEMEWFLFNFWIWLIMVLDNYCPFCVCAKVYECVFAMGQPKLDNTEKFKFQVIFGF